MYIPPLALKYDVSTKFYQADTKSCSKRHAFLSLILMDRDSRTALYVKSSDLLQCINFWNVWEWPASLQYMQRRKYHGRYGICCSSKVDREYTLRLWNIKFKQKLNPCNMSANLKTDTAVSSMQIFDLVPVPEYCTLSIPSVVISKNLPILHKAQICMAIMAFVNL